MPAALRGCGPSRSDLLPRAQVGHHDPDHAVHSCARCDRNLCGARYDQIRQEAVVSSSLVGALCRALWTLTLTRVGIRDTESGRRLAIRNAGSRCQASGGGDGSGHTAGFRGSVIVAMPDRCNARLLRPGRCWFPSRAAACRRRPPAAPGLQAARRVHGSSSAPAHTERHKRVCAQPRQHVCGVRRLGLGACSLHSERVCEQSTMRRFPVCPSVPSCWWATWLCARQRMVLGRQSRAARCTSAAVLSSFDAGGCKLAVLLATVLPRRADGEQVTRVPRAHAACALGWRVVLKRPGHLCAAVTPALPATLLLGRYDGFSG